MHLRFKTLLASSIATIILVVGLSAGLSFLILRQISDMETGTMSRRLNQTLKSLVDDVDGPSPARLPGHPSHPAPEHRPNLPEMGSAKTDVIITLDASGRPLPQPGTAPLSPGLQAVLANLPAKWVGLPIEHPPTSPPAPGPQGVQGGRPGTKVGFVQTPEGLLLLVERSARPHSARPGQPHHPPQQQLLGQWLRAERLKQLGERSLLKLELLSLNDPQVPAQLLEQSQPVSQVIEDYWPTPDFLSEFRSKSKHLPNRNLQFHAGYLLLRDVNGQPVAVLQAISPKPFVAQGEAGVKILLIFLWITVLLFGLGLNLLLDRWVLSRLANLSNQLKLVKADFSHSTQIELPGHDEISNLALEINTMLRQQELYQENLRQAKAEIEAANRELERLASTDGLTQVTNRRYFQTHLEKLWQDVSHTAQPISLLLCDVDFFKIYNDTYGHLAGDVCLQKVAKAMSAVLASEPTAILARYGGEEFAAILPNMPLSRVMVLAEQMRVAVVDLQIPHAGSKAADCVTLSMGVCHLIPHGNLTERDLIACADKHLYQAKAEGRNRVIAELPTNDGSQVAELSINDGSRITARVQVSVFEPH